MSNSKSPSRPLAVKPFGRLPALGKRQKLAELIVQRWQAYMPDPKCELYYETPYQLLVSVVLSAQTTDKSVNAAMTPIYRAGFDPQRMLKLGQKRFQEKIKTIGLAPTKAKNVTNLSRQLIAEHGGMVPNNRSALEALPGVGRKTANVILGELFGEPTIAVDTHVFRVGMRLGFHREKTPEKAELELLKVINPKYLPAAHHWLILHGRYTCKAIKPNCSDCRINDLCLSSPLTQPPAVEKLLRRL